MPLLGEDSATVDGRVDCVGVVDDSLFGRDDDCDELFDTCEEERGGGRGGGGGARGSGNACDDATCGAGYSNLLNASISAIFGDTRWFAFCADESMADSAASISGPLVVVDSADNTLWMAVSFNARV